MNKSPQRQREYALYRYHKALERGDLETVAAVLKEAENDPLLNQMIAGLDSELESASELETGYSPSAVISLPSSLNGQPPKLDPIKEQPDMTTQARYWEPSQSADRANRWAVAMALLVGVLVIGILFLFLIPSGSSKQTLVIQQPTLTPADIAKQYVDELWGKDNQDLAKTLLATDFVDHDPMFVSSTSTDHQNDSDFFTYNIKMLHNGLPDLTVKTDTVVLSEDQISVRWTFTGTFTQPFLNYAATHKKVTMTNTDILSIKAGQIVERWGQNNLLTIMDAMGIVTVPQEGTEAVTAFARFAYLFGADKIDDLGEAFTDPLTFNGESMSLKDFKATAGDIWTQSNGTTNIKMISATVVGNHVTAKVEFYTDKGKTLNHGVVLLTITDGKMSSYDYTDGP